MNYTYILYSKKIDRYYIGASHKEIESRFASYNSKKYCYKSYTSQSDDWKLVLKNII